MVKTRTLAALIAGLFLILLNLFKLQPTLGLHISSFCISSSAYVPKERQNSSITKKGKPPFPWQWVHVAKTGSSFANAFVSLSCPDEIENLIQQMESSHNETLLQQMSFHTGLGFQGASDECRRRWVHAQEMPNVPAFWMAGHSIVNSAIPYSQVFFTVRDPVQRIISYQLMHHRSRFGGVNWTDPWDVANRSVREFQEYNFGEQLREEMINYLAPADRRKEKGYISDATIRAIRACEAIEHMPWIGVTDRFNESICLLHQMFEFPVHPKEMMNVRPGSLRKQGTSYNVEEVGLIFREMADVPDDIVYECAIKRFERDMLHHGQTCKENPIKRAQ